VVEPKFEEPPVGRGRVMCGFMMGDALWMRRCRQLLSCSC
jgi:hypothetical protein